MSLADDWDPLKEASDVLIVGAGAGGTAAGYSFAQAGRRVLFCELGGTPEGAQPLLGQYPELAEFRNGSVPVADRDAIVLARGGRSTDTLIDAEHRGRRSFVPFIGSGPGGSTALYGMALERLTPHDFEPGPPPADAPGTSAVTRWPIGYRDLAPYYARAETLFRVRGEADPLSPSPSDLPADYRPQLLPPLPLSPAMAELVGLLQQRGLHPYRLPLACDGAPSCDTCQGVLCHKACKNDASRVLLQPVLATGRARILSGCRVLEIVLDGRRACGVRVTWRGERRLFRSACVVLAAGALQSPLILMRSKIGNDHDQVGRNLMRHFIDIVQVKPANREPGFFDNRRKEMAFNDFYRDGGVRLGTIQSFGRLPPTDMLFGALVDDVRASVLSPLAPLLPIARPILEPALRSIERDYLNLASIVEDYPYAEHRIIPVPDDPGRACLHYTMKPEAQTRVSHMRRRLRNALAGRRTRLLAQAHNNQRIAHACGTCRMGDDPRSSVLDRFNRVHGVDSLYVVDASFFPSSGGTNPTLTILANALRVADHIMGNG